MADYDMGEYDDLPPGDLRRQLAEAKAEAREAKQKAQEADTLRAKIETLEREGTIRDAGLNLNATQRQALAAVHNGSWEADAITKTATDLGFYTPPAEPPVVDDPSLAVHAQIAAASAGTDAPPSSRDVEIDSRLDKAQSEAEFLAVYRESGRPLHA